MLINPFTCHNPYSIEDIINRNWDDNERNYLLIDPGRTYFCARFERRTKSKPIDTDLKSVDGWYIATQKFIMIDFNSKWEEWKNYSTLYARVTKVLDHHIDLIRNVHIIAIEEQMRDNYEMMRLSQHLISYFIVRSSEMIHMPLILELNNQCKTKLFNYVAPKNMTSAQRSKNVKKWAIEFGLSLLNCRNDTTGLRIIQQSIKYDDPMDTVVMGEAVFMLQQQYEACLAETRLIKKKQRVRRKR